MNIALLTAAGAAVLGAVGVVLVLTSRRRALTRRRVCRRVRRSAGSVAEHRCEAGEGGGERVLGRLGVADDECGRVGVRAVRVGAEPLDRQAARGGVGDDVLLAYAAGKLDERVQAGGDSRIRTWGACRRSATTNLSRRRR